MRISNIFPRYTKYDPKVPVYCVTPNEGRVLHRFFDTSPFSPSGRYMALFRVPNEEDVPKPGDYGEIVIVDLEAGTEQLVAISYGFEHQLGANINWGKDDDHILYNDVNPETWEYYGVHLNWKTGKKIKLEMGVYHVSSDGRYALTGNPSLKWRTQSGYGVLIPKELTKTVSVLSEDEGLFKIDITTGKAELLLSMKTIFETCYDQNYIEEKMTGECYLFHSKFSPSDKKIMFSTRWIPEEMHNIENVIGKKKVRFIVFTCNADGSNLQASIPEKHWLNGGHHTTWHPDEEHLTMNIKKDWGEMRFASVVLDGSDLLPVCSHLQGSGHPTFHPNGKFLITDVYAHESLAYGDGTAPLRLVWLEDGTEEVLLRIQVESPYQKKDIALRVDPHPAWDRTNRYVAFNAFEGGTRRVYVMDMYAYL